MGEPAKVTEGEQVHLSVGRGSERVAFDVLPACDVKDQGHWCCATHDTDCPSMAESFGHRRFSDSASEHGCRAVWICHQHGPEVP